MFSCEDHRLNDKHCSTTIEKEKNIFKSEKLKKAAPLVTYQYLPRV